MNTPNKRSLRVRWTEEEDNLLRLQWREQGNKMAMLLPARSILAIQQRAVILGIANARGEVWTVDEDELLRLHWPKQGTGCIDRLPGRTKRGLQSRAKKLKLRCVLAPVPRPPSEKPAPPPRRPLPANSIFDLAMRAA